MYSVILLICLLVLFSSNIFLLFMDSSYITDLIGIGFRIVFLIILFIYLKKESYSPIEISRFNVKTLLFLPFLLISCSNLLAGLINNSPLVEPNYLDISISAVNFLLVATSEEIVFRHALMKSFKPELSEFKIMLYSSLIFGGIHLLNISSLGSIPYVIAQSLYTTALGMLFALAYIKTKNIIVPIIIHFLFNFINDSVAVNIFDLTWDYKFILVNVGVGVIFALYWLYLYFHFNKKDSIEC